MLMFSPLRALALSLCPESCPRCGDESMAGFCAACSADFARVVGACHACGLPGAAHACPATAAGWRLDAVFAPFAYTAPLSLCLQRLKFARQHRLGRALGLLLAREMAGGALVGRAYGSPIDAGAFAGSGLACDLLVPVPLHPRRLRERTFNQADEIARPIARSLGLAQRVGGIRRAHHTGAQTGLARAERLANLERAFRVSVRLDGARIALVDDVITTGATVNALAAALKEAGARHVEAWAVARTVEPAAEPEPGPEPAQSTRKM
jgi:ComF family protein